MRFLNFPALVSLPLLASPVAASPDAQFRDLTVQQASTTEARTPCVAADRADWTYAVGETVGLRLTSDKDAYVTVVDIGPTGRITQLFPNQCQPDNHVFANSPVEIGGNSGARVTVTGASGRTHQGHRVPQAGDRVLRIPTPGPRRFPHCRWRRRDCAARSAGGIGPGGPQRHPDYETNFSLHTIASPVAGAPALIMVRDNRRPRT
jgi:hypothetical protein